MLAILAIKLIIDFLANVWILCNRRVRYKSRNTRLISDSWNGSFVQSIVTAITSRLYLDIQERRFIKAWTERYFGADMSGSELQMRRITKP